MSIKSQSENYTPPLLGQVITMTVDATSRSKDWGALAIGGLPVLASDASLPGEFYVDIRCSVAAHIAFGPAAGVTIDETAMDAAAAAPTLRANAPWPVSAGENVRYRVSRYSHRYFYIKASGAGHVHLRISSPVEMSR